MSSSGCFCYCLHLIIVYVFVKMFTEFDIFKVDVYLQGVNIYLHISNLHKARIFYLLDCISLLEISKWSDWGKWKIKIELGSNKYTMHLLICGNCGSFSKFQIQTYNWFVALLDKYHTHYLVCLLLLLFLFFSLIS